MKRLSFKEILSSWKEEELLTLKEKVENNNTMSLCFKEVEKLVLYIKLKYSELISEVYRSVSFHHTFTETKFDIIAFGDRLKYELGNYHEDYILFLGSITHCKIKAIIQVSVDELFKREIDYICTPVSEKMDAEIFSHIEDILREVVGLDKSEIQLKLEKLNNAYMAGNPIIPDKEYDILFKDISNPSLVGVKIDKDRKRKLPIPMFSLDKNKSIEELQAWIKKNNLENELFVITPKFDGCSICNTNSEYYTRGDGEYGQLCTSHIKPYQSSFLEDGVVNFGELIIKKSIFNEKYADKYKNPRNMVSGILADLNPSPEVLRDLDYIVYGCVSDIQRDKSDELTALQLDYITFPYRVYNNINIDKGVIDNLYRHWSETLDYEIDGLVIELDSYEVRERLGREINNNPAYSRALKFNWEERRVSEVTNIKVEVSKQGFLKPVIEIEPIELKGVTITNISGYNMRWVIDNNIKKGCKVEVIRSGDVIPKIIKTITQDFYSPENNIFPTCPICGGKTEWNSNKVELVCTNEYCDGRGISQLVDTFRVLEFEDFGRPTIEKLYSNGFNSLFKILLLDKYDLNPIPGFGEVSIDKLLKQIDNLREKGVSLPKLQAASNCFLGLGEKTLSLFPADPEEVEDSELIKIEGLGEQRILQWRDGWKKFAPFYLEISTVLKVIEEKVQIISSGELIPVLVVFTGFRDRDMEMKIKEKGGQVLSSVSGRTSHLLVKDKNSNSSSMQKAKKLSIPILTKEEFLNLNLI